MDGRITVAMNIYKDLCYLQKPGGAPLNADIILRLIDVCTFKAAEVTKKLRDALMSAAGGEKHLQKKKEKFIVPLQSEPIKELGYTQMEEENADQLSPESQDLEELYGKGAMEEEEAKK